MELRSEFLSESMEARKKVGKCLYKGGKKDLAKVSFKDEDKIKTIPDKRDCVSSRLRL